MEVWKYFKYRSLAMNFLDSSAKIYGDVHVVPVCPSVTRWTAHERACHTFHTNYRHFLNALAVGFNERKEPEALGLFIQATSSANIATMLMLLEVFRCIKPLILSLQKSQGSICLTDAQSYVHISMQNLELLKTESTRNYLTSENIKKLQTVAPEELLNMPSS